MASATRRPETLTQARRFDRVCRLLLDFGLCPVCAPQGAWALQVGYSEVATPCVVCRPVVALLPVQRVNGWRSVEGRVDDPRSWAPLTPSPGTGAADAQAVTDRPHVTSAGRLREREG